MQSGGFGSDCTIGTRLLVDSQDPAYMCIAGVTAVAIPAHIARHFVFQVAADCAAQKCLLVSSVKRYPKSSLPMISTSFDEQYKMFEIDAHLLRQLAYGYEDVRAVYDSYTKSDVGYTATRKTSDETSLWYENTVAQKMWQNWTSKLAYPHTEPVTCNRHYNMVDHEYRGLKAACEDYPQMHLHVDGCNAMFEMAKILTKENFTRVVEVVEEWLLPFSKANLRPIVYFDHSEGGAVATKKYEQRLAKRIAKKDSLIPAHFPMFLGVLLKHRGIEVYHIRGVADAAIHSEAKKNTRLAAVLSMDKDFVRMGGVRVARKLHIVDGEEFYRIEWRHNRTVYDEDPTVLQEIASELQTYELGDGWDWCALQYFENRLEVRPEHAHRMRKPTHKNCIFGGSLFDLVAPLKAATARALGVKSLLKHKYEVFQPYLIGDPQKLHLGWHSQEIKGRKKLVNSLKNHSSISDMKKCTLEMSRAVKRKNLNARDAWMEVWFARSVLLGREDMSCIALLLD